MPDDPLSAASVPADAADLIATAHRLADRARAETLPRFRAAELRAEDKAAAGAGFDPVTEADRAAEAAMREMLAETRPEDGVLGEELGAAAGRSGLTWVIDPIDGTRAFMAGAPTWGTLIAVCDASGPLFGVIDQPWTGERWEGGLGRARLATPHGETPLRARPAPGPDPLAGAILCSTYPEVGAEEERAAFARVADRVRLTRYGLDCYAYGLIAAGQIDLVIEAGLQPYDICAPIAVIEAAGGIVTTWDGGPARAGGRILAAANPQVHAAALALLDSA
jgi:myo-inositol-1(or 4)-monophosphatase